jgi:hypothetical protein
MNTFKRKALFTAVLAGLGAAGSAEAVYLNPNGTGQVLIYPYYTVQSANGNAWNTYLSVVNTTSRAKAVKVRVLEGKTSVEVLDFNLFLSANDMWTAAIIPGPGDGARIVTSDTSCTNPVGQMRVDLGGSGEPFRNFQYLAGVNGAIGEGLDRTREGYVEIIEMGTLTGDWEAAVTHSAGVPEDCTEVQGVAPTPSSVEAPTGGLSGTGTLINVNNGSDAGYKADALEAWSVASNYTGPGFTDPNLGDAFPAVSVVVRAGDAGADGSSSAITAYRNVFVPDANVSAGAKAVASVFMRTAVLNEYVLDAGTVSQTDWVITQPVKNLFVSDVTAAPPYTSRLVTAGACEDISFEFWNREEAQGEAGGADFSPTPDAEVGSICWESTVLSIRNGSSHTASLPTDTSGVLGSFNVTAVNVTSSFQSGWGRLTFVGDNANPLVGMGSSESDRISMGSDVGSSITTGSAAPVTFFGLPVTGFMVRTFQNTGLVCGGASCQGNYGNLFNHSYITTITP